MQAQAYAAGHALGKRRVEGVGRAAQRRRPQAVVHQLRVLAVEKGLEAKLVARQYETFECLMRGDQSERTRAFVYFTRLDADDAVFDEIDSPDAVRTGANVERGHQRGPVQALAARYPLREIDHERLGLARTICRRGGPGKG